MTTSPFALVRSVENIIKKQDLLCRQNIAHIVEAETRYNMNKAKKETFQMRISKDTRADLDRVAKHYNLSASATVDMLIAKETRLIDKQRKEDESNG